MRDDQPVDLSVNREPVPLVETLRSAFEWIEDFAELGDRIEIVIPSDED